MVLHIGSGQEGKENASNRFINNFKSFPDEVKNKVILENDDKVFTAKETLNICTQLNIPMVLDVHHHLCNNEGEALEFMIEDIFNTWNKEPLPPKVHFSSPKTGNKDRKHADYINAHEFFKFLQITKPLQRDFDVMIEAKKKDLALYKLAEDLKEIGGEFRFIDESTLEM